jgi:translocation and assembly module TamB
LFLSLVWALRTESGSAWVLARVPGLELEQAQGALLGDFSARRLAYALPAEAGHLSVQDLRWQGLSLAWSNSPLLWGELHLEQLSAARVKLQLAPSKDEASQPPSDLLLPLALRIGRLQITELQGPGLEGEPLRHLQASLWLGADGGERHRLSLQALQWQHYSASGQAQIGSRGQLELFSSWTLAQQQGALPWQAELQLNGPLQTPVLKGRLQAAGQALELQAALRPFASLPLTTLQAQAKDLDLAALWPGAPTSRLSGELALQPQPSARGAQPGQNGQNSEGGEGDEGGGLALTAMLRNDASGRLDQQRLPLQALALDLRLDPRDWTRLRLPRLALRLHGGGQVLASGHSDAQDGSTLTLRLSGLDSQQLDSGWPLMRAQGELRLSSRASLARSAEALNLQGELSGLLGQGALQAPMALQLQASLQPQALQLLALELRSGPARLQAQGQLQLQRPYSLAGGWQTQAQAQLQGLDPRRLSALLGPGHVAAGYELNAKLDARLRGQAGQLWPEGEARLQLLPSQLATLPLQGQLDYQRSARAAPVLQGQLQLADAQAQARSEGQGRAAQVALKLDLPRLAALQPLLQAFWPQARVQGQLQAQGSLALEDGDARLQWQASGLKLAGLPPLPDWSLAQTSGQAALGLDADDELKLQAELKELKLPQGRLETGRLTLDGRWSQHQLKLDLQARLPLPAALQGTAKPLHPDDPQLARLQLAFKGALQGLPRQVWQGGGRWQARELRVVASPAQGQPWLQGSGLALQLDLRPGLAMDQLQLAAGRLDVLGAGLRWQRADWAGERDWALDLMLEPLAVAPLLARLQPDFGWGGDLLMDGHLNGRHDARGLQLDLALTRSGGDLKVTDELSTQALGLSELRLALLADQGVWHLTQAIAGRNLGAVGGAISARVADPHDLPGRDARLEGGLQAQVANLGNWGAWMPAGWRLGGSLFATLNFSGTLAQRQLHGRAGGQDLSLRNPLLGVDMSKGELALELAGQQARLTKLSAQAGAGQLLVQGDARFGAQPSASLQIKASKFALLQRVDRRLVSSGEATLELGADSLALQGQFAVDEGLLDLSRANAPALDSDVQVLREAQPGKPVASDNSRPLNIRLDLGVDLGRQLRLKGYGIDTRLGGELKLTHEKGQPQLYGEVRTRGGNFAAYGQKLEVERGLISFNGVLDNPRLDVLAIRPDRNEEVRVGVTVTGTARNPRIKLYSDPELSDSAKLSWLVLGRSPDNLGGADTLLLQRAALALLSGDGESPSDKLIKGIGLDELSFRDDGDSTKGTVVRLGKQLSRNVYFGYERGLNATAGNWQLIYKLAQRFTLRAQAGEDQGLDLIWQWKWE